MREIYPGFFKYFSVNENPTATATSLRALPVIFTKNSGAIFLL
jgi:hypothetical protein